MKIEDLNIPPSTTEHLKETLKISMVFELAFLTEEYISKLRGIGSLKLARIKEILQEQYGLSLGTKDPRELRKKAYKLHEASKRLTEEADFLEKAFSETKGFNKAAHQEFLDALWWRNNKGQVYANLEKCFDNLKLKQIAKILDSTHHSAESHPQHGSSGANPSDAGDDESGACRA